MVRERTHTDTSSVPPVPAEIIAKIFMRLMPQTKTRVPFMESNACLPFPVNLAQSVRMNANVRCGVENFIPFDYPFGFTYRLTRHNWKNGIFFCCSLRLIFIWS